MFRALVTAVKNKQTKKPPKTKTYEKPLPSCLLGEIYNKKKQIKQCQMVLSLMKNRATGELGSGTYLKYGNYGKLK